MFLTATLSLNPSDDPAEDASQDDEVAKSRIVYQKTFPTSSILKQLVSTMQGIGISDAAVLTHDGVEVFRDTKGDDDDIAKALDHFIRETPATAKRKFNTLRVVLGHEVDLLKFVIDIGVEWIPDVDAHAIEVKVAGFLQAFRSEDGFTPELQELFESIFQIQSDYDAVCTAAGEEFDAFVKELNSAFRDKMKLTSGDFKSARWMVSADHTLNDATDGRRQLFDHSCIEKPDILYCYEWHTQCLKHNVSFSDSELINYEDGAGGHSIYPEPQTPAVPSPEQVSIKHQRNPFRDLHISPEKFPHGFLGVFAPTINQVLEVVAKEIGAKFTPWTTNLVSIIPAKMVYVWEGHAISLTHTPEDEGPGVTEVSTGCDSFKQFKCQISRTSLMRFAGESWFGLKDIDVGDERFDREFLIRCNNPNEVKSFLSDTRIRTLISLHPAISLSIGQDITFSCDGAIKDSERLVRLFELFVELLQRLEDRK